MTGHTQKALPWKVYWEGSFWGKGKKGSHAGREVPVKKAFLWGKTSFFIPAVYLCASGLMVDFCVRAEPEILKPFLSKWAPLERNGLSREEQEQAALENPLDLPFHSQISVNGRVLSETRGCGISWVPPELLPEDLRTDLVDADAAAILDHYGLDPRKGWAIWRKSYPWATKRCPHIKKSLLTLREEPKPIPGEHFTVTASGDTIAFVHPLTGAAYKLTVREYERQQFDFSSFSSSQEGWEHPAHFISMTCLVEPPLPQSSLSFFDRAPGDPSRKRQESPLEPQAKGTAAMAMGIIGGADGPATIFLSEKGEKEEPSYSIHAAASSLYFTPPEKMEWCMSFREKSLEDVSVTLDLFQNV